MRIPIGAGQSWRAGPIAQGSRNKITAGSKPGAFAMTWNEELFGDIPQMISNKPVRHPHGQPCLSSLLLSVRPVSPGTRLGAQSRKNRHTPNPSFHARRPGEPSEAGPHWTLRSWFPEPLPSTPLRSRRHLPHRPTVSFSAKAAKTDRRKNR